MHLDNLVFLKVTMFFYIQIWRFLDSHDDTWLGIDDNSKCIIATLSIVKAQ